jgi:hypothetical protein
MAKITFKTYISPVTGKLITNARQRKADMKKSGAVAPDALIDPIMKREPWRGRILKSGRPSKKRRVHFAERTAAIKIPWLNEDEVDAELSNVFKRINA